MPDGSDSLATGANPAAHRHVLLYTEVDWSGHTAQAPVVFNMKLALHAQLVLKIEPCADVSLALHGIGAGVPMTGQ
jgi:hypothetical protein